MADAGQLTYFFAGMQWVAAILVLVAGMQSAVDIVVTVLLNGIIAIAQTASAFSGP